MLGRRPATPRAPSPSVAFPQHPRLGLDPAGADRDVESHPRLRSTYSGFSGGGLGAAAFAEERLGGAGGGLSWPSGMHSYRPVAPPKLFSQAFRIEQAE